MDFTNQIIRYRDRENEVLQKLPVQDINCVLNVLENARKKNQRFFICGNGGSAATASHYACDFNKGVNMGLAGVDSHTRNPSKNVAELIRSSGISLYDFECLSDNQPTMQAVSNDESYDEVFRYPLSIKMKKNDVVIGISGSGNSKNVINAFEYASKHGGVTIAIVGYDGGRMKQIADYNIHVAINDMQIAEDMHMILDHMMMWVLTHNNIQ